MEEESHLKSSGMRHILPLLLLFTSQAHSQYWLQVPDFPGTARDDAAAFSIGTHAYFGTGMETGWGLTSDWWMLDIVGNPQWYPVPDLPAEPRQYCVGFNFPSGDHGYLFGGLSASGPLDELWSFSEATNSWVQLASMPAAGRYASTAFTIGNKAYVVGGLITGGTATNECWSYDPATDVWAQVAAMPGVARHRATSFESGSFGYVIGGADSAYNALAETWKYDATTDQWTAAAPLPEPRYDAAPLRDIDTGIVGGASDDTTFHANAYFYAPVADSWSEMIDPLPYGVRGASGTYAGGGGGWYFNVIGTGIDNDLVRRTEMFTYGFVFGIEDLVRAPLKVYPNPATHTVTANWPTTWPAARIQVIDALGRTVRDELVNTGSPIDVSRLSPGRYVVEAKHGTTQLRGKLTLLP